MWLQIKMDCYNDLLMASSILFMGLTGKIGCRVKNYGARKYKLPEIVVGLHRVG